MAVMDILVRAQDQATQVLNNIDKEIDEVGRTGQVAGRTLSDSLNSAADSMASAGRTATTRLTLPLVAAGIAAFNMGSDLQESISQAGVVFGGEADKVITASENMNDAFSQADFLGFAGNLGDIAQGLGIAKDEADDTALAVLSLSQDLSSFKNVPVEQAVGAITSALTGEREALKGLGIVLKDTDVKQKALELGLWDGVGALSSAAQAQATMALITEKSANAIGDFERTADGAANQSRILTGNLKDQAAALGTQLLPIGLAILDWLSGMVQWFSNLSPGVQKVILVIAGLAAAIGPVLIIGAKLIQSFMLIGKAFSALSALMAANPWLLLIAATVALVVLIVANWDKIVGFLKGVWEWIKGAAESVADFLSGVWNKVTSTVSRVWNGIIDFFKALPGRIMGAIQSLATTVLNFILKYHPVAIIFRTASELWPKVRDWFASLPGKIKSAIGDLAKLLFDAGKKIITGLWDGLKAAWGNVTGWLGNVGGWIADIKGPAEVDARLLTKNGQLIMGGLLQGLQNSWPRVSSFLSGRASDMEGAFGSPVLGVSGSGAIGAGSLAGVIDALMEQNSLLRAILDKTGFFIDGRDLADAIGEPFVNEVRARTGR